MTPGIYFKKKTTAGIPAITSIFQFWPHVYIPIRKKGERYKEGSRKLLCDHSACNQNTTAWPSLAARGE